MALGASFGEVLDAARVGAPWALAALYRDLAPAVLGYLRGQGAAEAEDVASEVFVAMVQRLPAFEGGERDFRAWVFSIAHRRLQDERRRLAKRRDVATDPAAFAGSLPGTPTGDVEEEALARLGGGWILRALSSLTPEQRAVLLLRILADLSIAEVARVLGKRQGAVKTLQRRALRALARNLEREGVT